MGIRLGDFQLDVVSDGTFRLDGGAMFGVVPRVLWERYFPADEKHRITLGLNTLLIRTPDETILVDTGIGEKWSDKHREMYGIAHETTVPQSLAKLGLTTADVTMVICTHLHFDHVGGNTYRDADGTVKPTFPNARYVVQREEFEHARAPHERDRASYMKDDWEPVAANGQLTFAEGEQEIAPGVTVIPVRGHNDFTQCVKITSNGETAFYWADVLPTTAHLPYAWVMGYDLYPVELLENKKKLIPQSVAGRWLNVFEHDPNMPMGYIEEQDGKFKVIPPAH